MTRVLIVDDKHENLYLLKALLQGHGCVVDEARHGAEALVKARQAPPDLAISDLLMPVMDGYTLLRHWKIDERLKCIPFIVYTATYTEPRDERLALDLGADAFILKPAEPDVFMARIHDFLGRSQQAERPSVRMPRGDPEVMLKDYGDVLIRKLEEKALQLAQANSALQEDLSLRRRAESEANRLRNESESARVALLSILEDQKRAETALRESEARFRALFEYSLDGVLLTVPDGQILAANPAACRILGRSEKEICSVSRGGIVDADDPRLAALLDERARTGRARGELTMIRGDGTHFEAEASSAVFLSAEGPRTGMVIRDITERKRTELALQESEARYRLIADNTSDIIILYDVEVSRFLYVSPSVIRMIGYRPEEMLGQPIDRFLLPGMADRIVHYWRRIRDCLNTGEISSQHSSEELVLVAKTGAEVPTEIVTSWLPDANGQRNLTLSVVRDITERRRTRDALEKFNLELEQRVAARTAELASRNREVQALLQSIPDMVMRLRSGGTVLYCQKAHGEDGLAALGCRPECDKQSCLNTELRAPVLAVGRRALEKGAAVMAETELRVAGSPTTIELRAAPVGSGSDEFVVFVRDITARRRAETEVAKALEKEREVSQMKGRFISVTSHEFRTPMAAAVGSTELLAKHIDKLAPAKRQELLARIQSSLGRMTEMLDDVLTLNRAESGRVRIQVMEMDLGEFVRDILDEIRVGDHEAHRFECSIDGDAGRVATDSSVLRHVLSNLLSNAVRYSPVNSTISVGISVSPAEFRLAVADEGIGVPEADRARIFEPFERGSNVGEIRGTGLGLNIVRRMAEMLGGSITLSPESGRGACFIAAFPLPPPSSPPT